MTPYEVGIHLTAKNGISAVLAAIAGDLMGITGKVGLLRKEFEKLNGLVIGGAMLGGAVAVAEVYKDIAKHGEDLLDQQEQLNRAGISNLDVLKLTEDAYKKIAKAVPTAPADQILKTAREMRAIAGPKASLDQLEAMAAKALQVDALLSNTFGTEQHGEFYKLLRSSEMKGIATDDTKREALVESMFSYITAFGGKLTANDFQTMARRGGTAWMNAKPEAIGPLAVLGAELGGATAGQTLMTLQQLQMGANTLSKQQGDILKQAGLLDMSKVSPTGFGGGRMQVAPGGILGSTQYAGDLPGWIKNVVYPHILAAAGGDDALAQQIISKISPNRNAAKLIDMFGSPGFLDQQAKDLGLAAQVKPIVEAYLSFITKNPKGVEAAFEAQKKSMLEAIGAPVMQAAIPVMQAITSMFTKIGELANANAGGVKLFGEGLAALSAGLTVGGLVTIGTWMLGLSATIAGWPIAAAAALVAALGTLAAFNWSTISGGIETLIGSLNAFSEGLRGIVEKIGSWLKDMLPSWMTGSGGVEKGGFTGSGFGGGASIHKASYGSAASSFSGGTGGGTSAAAPGLYGAIIHAEGTAQRGDPYNTVLGYGAYGSPSKPLTSMTLAEAYAFGRTVLHRHGSSSALGAFQIVGTTMKAAMAGLGLHPGDMFSAENQRRMADWIVHHQGLGAWEGFKSHPGDLSAARRALSGPHAVPNVPPYRPPSHAPVIENTMILDGEVVHRSIVRRIVHHATHPTSAPLHDGMRHWTPPDVALVGA